MRGLLGAAAGTGAGLLAGRITDGAVAVTVPLATTAGAVVGSSRC